jgi:hypothetical protein
MDIGQIIATAKGVFKVLQGTEAEGYVPPTAPAAPPAPVPHQESGPLPRADRDMSEHFGLFELTKTNNAALQAKNRILTDAQMSKLHELAMLMEKIRTIIGGAVDVHSAYRCPDLNAATQAAAKKSQHMLCEACDWSPAGPDTVESIEIAFQKVIAAARRGEIKFGQLIVEQANRGYSKSIWVHISLGLPHRDPARCGEIMRMVENDGVPVYTLIERLPA